MIGEFAFTPSVFDEEANPESESWKEQLRELGSTMFPRTAAWPVMVSNLYDGSWHNEALNLARSIKDSRAKLLCEGLLKNINDVLVRRPPVKDWPTDGANWAREALASHLTEPIDRIIGCHAVRDQLATDNLTIRCIDEVADAGFWSGIASQWSQELKIADQVQAIRKLAVHAEFLCVISPHIRGEDTDETQFAVEMIQSALRRPREFGGVDIEVHAEAPEKPWESSYADRLRILTSNIRTSLLAALPPSQTVKLVLWPKLLDRYLVAGVYTEMSGGRRVRSPRWGIAMQHIARPQDTRAANPPTNWSLMIKSQLGDVFNRHCTGNPTAAVQSTTITR